MNDVMFEIYTDSGDLVASFVDEDMRKLFLDTLKATFPDNHYVIEDVPVIDEDEEYFDNDDDEENFNYDYNSDEEEEFNEDSPNYNEKMDRG